MNSQDEFKNIYQTARDIQANYLQVAITREEEFSDLLNNRASFRGTTALHYAVLAQHVPTIQVLIEKEANPEVLNELGHKPCDYAGELKSIKKLLIDYESKWGEIRKAAEAEERRKFPLENRIRQVRIETKKILKTV